MQQKEQDASGLSGLWRKEDISTPLGKAQPSTKEDATPVNFDQEGDDPRCGPVQHLLPPDKR